MDGGGHNELMEICVALSIVHATPRTLPLHAVKAECFLFAFLVYYAILGLSKAAARLSLREES